MAQKYVALLRGINVGRAKRVAMSDLRALFEDLGYRDVRTLLNSGNVVFTAPRSAPGGLARRIEKVVSANLGVVSKVVVLTAKELSDAIAGNPLLEVAEDPTRLLVAVLADPADRRRLRSLLEEDWRPEVLALGSRVAYMWLPGGVAESPLSKAVGRALGDAVTSRNWATITKLAAAVDG